MELRYKNAGKKNVCMVIALFLILTAHTAFLLRSCSEGLFFFEAIGKRSTTSPLGSFVPKPRFVLKPRLQMSLLMMACLARFASRWKREPWGIVFPGCTKLKSGLFGAGV